MEVQVKARSLARRHIGVKILNLYGTCPSDEMQDFQIECAKTCDWSCIAKNRDRRAVKSSRVS